MYNNKTFLAIIPARGGSKRLPKKNVLKLSNKPLIAWSIEAGLQSKYIDEVMVTTDDKEISSVSVQYGANIPFIRPEYLSNDTALRQDVIKHTIEYYKNNLQKEYDYIIFLQPTSPLRDSIDIDKAIEYMFTKNADAVVSVCEVEHPVHWSGTLPQDKAMSKFLSDVAIKSRSQDLEKYYRLNGAIYICDTKKFLDNGCIFLKENIYAFEMDQKKSVDIDTIDDFEYAEFLMDKSLILKQKITEEIFQSYTRQGFGRLLKSEIDLKMFDFSLKMIFLETKPEYFIDNELNYFIINKQDLYELSKLLKITESKIVGYIEQIGLLKGLLDDKMGLKSFKQLLLIQKQDKNYIEKGYLTVQISNKLVKQFIEAKITSLGYQVEYGNNKELIIVNLSVLLQIFDVNNDNFKTWIIKQKEFLNDTNLQDEFNKKDFDIKEIGIETSKTILSKLVRKSSDVLVDSFVKFIEEFNNE